MTINLSKIRQYLDNAPWPIIFGAGGVVGIALLLIGMLVGGAAGRVFASEPTPTLSPTAFPTLLPTATAALPPTLTPLPSPTLTPTPEVVYVIWSIHAEKVNMRDAPAGYIVTAIANGVTVAPLNEIIESNGYTWVKVEVGEQTGWIANSLIWEAEEGYRVLDGTRDCYTGVGGPFSNALFNGTPYTLLATAAEGKWMRIQLLDGDKCWLPIE